MAMINNTETTKRCMVNIFAVQLMVLRMCIVVQKVFVGPSRGEEEESGRWSMSSDIQLEFRIGVD